MRCLEVDQEEGQKRTGAGRKYPQILPEARATEALIQ
jgi:hypothetical protein